MYLNHFMQITLLIQLVFKILAKASYRTFDKFWGEGDWSNTIQARVSKLHITPHKMTPLYPYSLPEHCLSIKNPFEDIKLTNNEKYQGYFRP